MVALKLGRNMVYLVNQIVDRFKQSGIGDFDAIEHNQEGSGLK